MANYSQTSDLARLQFLEKIKQYPNLSERDSAALFAQCVELQVLKAPASAIFPGFQEMVVNGSNGRYNVSGYVDSQNSYGAMIRSKYTYNVEKDSAGNWKCTDHFEDTSTSINKQMFSNSLIWWILGILGTIITITVTSCQTQNMMNSLF